MPASSQLVTNLSVGTFPELVGRDLLLLCHQFFLVSKYELQQSTFSCLLLDHLGQDVVKALQKSYKLLEPCCAVLSADTSY